MCMGSGPGTILASSYEKVGSPTTRHRGTSTRPILDVTECHPAFAEVIRRHFKRHTITRQDANAEFAHLATGICNELVAVFESHPVACIRKDLINLSLHFN